MTTTTMRFFNTAGPIKPAIHYHVPPLARLDAEGLLMLIRQEKYFVLHAPRQTGKTSALLALQGQLNASGEFRCAYVNVEVGQPAREDVAREAIWELTQGQPWLVNALAYEACWGNKAGRDRRRSITAAAIQDACEQLILRRETHLDQLTDKLQEERVQRVIEPLLRGADAVESFADDDLQYVRDLGLVAEGGKLVAVWGM